MWAGVFGLGTPGPFWAYIAAFGVAWLRGALHRRQLGAQNCHAVRQLCTPCAISLAIRANVDLRAIANTSRRPTNNQRTSRPLLRPDRAHQPTHRKYYCAHSPQYTSINLR